MNFQKLLMALVCANGLLVPGDLLAAEKILSLSEAVQLTLDNNPQFRTYQLRNEALKGQSQIANQKPALQLSTEIENVIGTGDLNWFQGTELTLALSQVIEIGDKRAARVNTVSQRQNVLLAEQRVLELDLLSEVATRYIELASIERRQFLLARSSELARNVLNSVSVRVDAGRAPEAERARAIAAVSMAELAEQSLSFSALGAAIQLSSLWGVLQPTFAGIDANIMQLKELEPIEVLLHKLDKNPVITVFASESRLREAELREARSRRRANVEVGAGIRHLAGLNDTALLFQVTVPLFSKNRNRGNVTSAQANLLRVGSEKETALLKMHTQLLLLDHQRRLALNEFHTLQDTVIPQLNVALDVTRTAFESGRYSYLELTVAQKEMLEAEFSLIEVAARAHLLRVEIERLSGEEFNNFYREIPNPL
ncbi:MAG: RND transporter [SAR86 cluster bacterium]|uniref:RND transporter n=1 Tax=SAR86 cluster bacterium TaxID=2030880 RepID=A0A2A5AYR6_9GAMM|nr:MAG: RND transporter [SAR86 cluster bacterium]